MVDPGKPKYAVIVAGGKGNRFGSEKPKQFHNLNAHPVIMYSIWSFLNYLPPDNICIVLNKSMRSEYDLLLKNYSDLSGCRIADGGSERFHSVKAGLNQFDEDGFVAVHDAVRPLVSKSIIEQGYELMKSYSAAIPVVQVKDSMRIISDSGSEMVNRDRFRCVQTPQFFHLNLIKSAYCQKYSTAFTDDALVFESLGKAVHLYQGDFNNIKITTFEDLKIAECLLR